MSTRSGLAVRLTVLSIAVMAALLAVVWATPLAGTPGAQASSVVSLSISKSCSPKAPVGGLVQYEFFLINTGSVALDRDSVIDVPNLGDISASFPAHLEPGASAAVTKFYTVKEADARPLVNTVTATYHAADGTVAVDDATCSVNVPHLTIEKTATFNPDGTTTFTFTLTNDGNGDLTRYLVTDTELGVITSQFPLFLAEGETKVVQIPNIPGQICENTVTAVYQSAATTVTARDTCERPPRGSITLTKVKQVGVFTIPTLVCFRLDFFDGVVFVPSPDPPEGAEQCKVPDGTGTATFTWTNLRFGDYRVVETREVCTREGVEEDPCTAYALLPPIPVTISESNPNVVLPDAENNLFPGTLRVEKRTSAGGLWSTPAVTFHVCRGSLTDCTTATASFIQSVVVGNGNPNPSNPIFLAEDFYTVCEVVPAGFTPDPSRCQVVKVFAGDSPSAGFVSFRNVPTDGARLAPTATTCQAYRDYPDNPANNITAVQYSVSGGKISNAVPGVFFYFTKLTIASMLGTADEVRIDQSSSIGDWKEFTAKFVRVYNLSCVKLFEVAACAKKTDCKFELGLTGAFIIQVQYESKSIIGSSPITCVGGTPTSVSTYTWSTKVNAVQVQTDSLDVTPKSGSTC